jgi:two-component system, sensor histidine kinase and response regulator
MAMAKNPSRNGEKLDRDSMLQRLDGNQELLVELVQLFQEEAPQLIATMRSALLQSDFQELKRAAHSMKGAAGNFSAQLTARAALRLESDAKNGDAESAKASLAALEAAVQNLLEELVELCQGAAK